MNTGKTLSASWAMRTTNPSFTTKEIVVLYAFISFMDANGFSSPGTARLMFVTRLGKTSVRRAVEILEHAGVLTLVRPHTDDMCSGYVVNIDKIAHQDSVCPPSNTPTSRYQGHVAIHPVSPQDTPCIATGYTPVSPGDPFEDHEDQNRIIEDSSLPLAPSQAPVPSVASPTTARSPSVEPKRKRAAKPKLQPLALEALTPYEREVHDAIVGDSTLVQICINVPQLARDLVTIAAGKLDVVAKVRALGAWNRNAAKSKVWSNGNKGLINVVTRDAEQPSPRHPPTRPDHVYAPANGNPAPMPSVVSRVQVVAPPPIDRDDLPKPLPGEETFLQRLARTDPVSRRILEQRGKLP